MLNRRQARSAASDASAGPRWCVLLTATIRAHDVIYCERRDTVQRQSDYERAIRFWAGERLAPRIVLVENSGADLSPLRQILTRAGWDDSEFELLSFTEEPYPPELGKSYGEMRILQFALEHSNIVRESDVILKGTGRYIPTNFFRVWSGIAASGAFVVMANQHGDRQSDSRFFAGSPLFFRTYLFACAGLLNDGKGYYMEHALHYAMERAATDGYRVVSFPAGGFLIDGVQGSRNVPFEYPYYKRIVYRIIALIRNRLPFHWKVSERKRVAN